MTYSARFYGLTLDKDQQTFVNKIRSKETIAVFCNAAAGTGKTTIALGAGNMLYHKGFYDGIVYIFSPVQEHRQGFIPGSPEEKSLPYLTPLLDAMDALKIDRKNLTQVYVSHGGNQKQFKPYIQAVPHTYLRGTNLSKKVVIIDECQNFTLDDFQKTLTRLHDDCKIICIGHSGQIDLQDKKDSAFARYLHAAKSEDFIEECTLTKNYRGKFSQWADSV